MNTASYVKYRLIAVLLALLILCQTAAPPLNAYAASLQSEYNSSITAATGVPGKVVLSSISSPAYNKITISWKAAAGATSYRIYYKAAGASKWKRIATVKPSQLQYTHTARRSARIYLGKDYTYTVRAYNNKTKKLGAYDHKGLTTHTVPNKVTMKQAVWNNPLTAVTVSWKSVKNVTYYRIYRRTPSAPKWKCIGTVLSDRLQFVDKDPSAGEQNYYAVRAGNKKAKVISKFGSSYATAVSQKEAAVQQTGKLIGKTSTAAKTNQIILVVDHNLSFWEKSADGNWKRKLSVYCGYGSNGLNDDRHEGDRTTPIGSFPILHGFGIASNPGTTMQYRKITNNSYWSGEYSTYNQWVESPRYVSGEHLIDYYQYKYAMAIGFNRNPTVYKKGSAIFLHCKSTDHWSTAGCVSVQDSVMKTLLQMSHNGVYIIIVPSQSDISSY